MVVQCNTRRSPFAEEGLLEDCDDERQDQEAPKSDTKSQALKTDTASISFGALVKAQASLSKRNGSHDILRCTGSRGFIGNSKVPRNITDDGVLVCRPGKKNMRDVLRDSKHAPAELSSKKAVSRKREVVSSQTTSHGDPRFEPFGGAINDQNFKKFYSFLNSYRDSEIRELKLAIRKTKDSKVKEKLKRALLSMESRKKVLKLKEQRQEVLRRHRKDEKEKIERGKRPYYLKKTDQKNWHLLEDTKV